MRFAIIVFFTFIHFQASAQQARSSDDILKQAYANAARENKNVFVIFTASWCIWCHKMDKSLKDPSVKAYFDRSYVIEHLVVKESPDKKMLENPGAHNLLKNYGGDELGIPFWLVFDKNGKLLADAQINPGENSGCPATQKEVDYFIEVLKQTSAITPEEIKLVEKKFRQNEQ